MNTVFTIQEEVIYTTISGTELENLLKKVRKWSVVGSKESDVRYRDDRHCCFFRNIDNPIKIAKEKGLAVMSGHFWFDNHSAFVVYLPKKGNYILKQIIKKKVPAEVSDTVYQDCLNEINYWRQKDLLYNWRPKNPAEYYSLENWPLHINNGQLVCS